MKHSISRWVDGGPELSWKDVRVHEVRADGEDVLS